MIGCFFVAGILACLRAVQHSLFYHDPKLSPQHKAAIDEWKKRTPMDGKESVHQELARPNP